MQALIQIKAELDLSTRRLRHINNSMNREPALDGMHMAVADMKRDYKQAVHRDEVGPCRTFNCHGLTFGSRRTWIDRPADIQKILDDDDYVEVDIKNVKPGDIAIYRKNGEIDHSGIVVDFVQNRPRILSKWAFLHEVVHFPWDCPYNEGQVTYYRVTE
jgi:uncharacterized protein YijF (DUF1287 family)